MGGQRKTTSTIDNDEVAHFSRLSSQWWDAHGPLRALHKFNPLRVAYIRDHTAVHFARDPARCDSLAGLRILDIGCGGGILSEPLARLGAAVVGVDPSQSNIGIAQHHAAQEKLSIEYWGMTVEDLAATCEAFDVVLAMEVIEHVADVGLFIELAATMVKPGGLMFFATFNRTLKSFALGIVTAEYILRWVPRGTHRWGKFVTPDELEALIKRGGLRLIQKTGVIYKLLTHRWWLSSNFAVNYMVIAERPA